MANKTEQELMEQFEKELVAYDSRLAYFKRDTNAPDQYDSHITYYLYRGWKMAQKSAASVGEGVPVAYSYELGTTIDQSGSYGGWRPYLTSYKPCVPDGSIRNFQPLYTAPLASSVDGFKARLMKLRAGFSPESCYGEGARDALQLVIDSIERGDFDEK